MPIEDAIAIAAGDVPGAADYLAKAAAAARLMRKRAAPGLADSLRDVAMTGLAGAGLGAAGLGGLGLVQGKSRRQVRNMALAGALGGGALGAGIPAIRDLGRPSANVPVATPEQMADEFKSRTLLGKLMGYPTLDAETAKLVPGLGETLGEGIDVTSLLRPGAAVAGGDGSGGAASDALSGSAGFAGSWAKNHPLSTAAIAGQGAVDLARARMNQALRPVQETIEGLMARNEPPMPAGAPKAVINGASGAAAGSHRHDELIGDLRREFKPRMRDWIPGASLLPGSAQAKAKAFARQLDDPSRAVVDMKGKSPLWRNPDRALLSGARNAGRTAARGASPLPHAGKFFQPPKASPKYRYGLPALFGALFRK